MPSSPTPTPQNDDENRDAEEQLTLFKADADSKLTKDIRGVGHFTGERLKKQRPQIYDAIVKCLAEGMGILRIAAAFNVSNNTVTAVRDAEGLSISNEKRQVSRNLRDFAKLGSERLVDEVANIPVAQLPIAIAVAIDKMQVLDGEPNRILETREKVRSIEDINAWIDTIENVTPEAQEMGFAGGDGVAKGVAIEGEFEVLGEAETPSADNESVANDSQVVDSQGGEDE